MEILVKNRNLVTNINLGQKSIFRSKKEILVKKQNFDTKSRTWSINRNFGQRPRF